VDNVRVSVHAGTGTFRGGRLRQKKKRAPEARFYFSNRLGSDNDDILGLRAFLALRDRELDFLAFDQGFEPVPGNVAEMSKYIRA
jgi:hypothetical protein